MTEIDGLSQEQLDALWSSIDDKKQASGVTKLVDDEAEQVMSVMTIRGELLVVRKKGGPWKPAETVGGGDFT